MSGTTQDSPMRVFFLVGYGLWAAVLRVVFWLMSGEGTDRRVPSNAGVLIRVRLEVLGRGEMFQGGGFRHVRDRTPTPPDSTNLFFVTFVTVFVFLDFPGL